MRRNVILIALLGFATLHGCAGKEPADRPVGPANVLLITIDALRADSVSWNGSAFQTTPNLDLLAERSVVFTQAFTSFPGTTASMPSLMSGLFPNFEGITKWDDYTFHGFNEFETEAETAQPNIADGLPMLAETLQSAGYRTMGFNTNPHLVGPRNFNQGFSDYEDFAGYMGTAQQRRSHPLESAYPPADVVMDKVVPVVEKLGDEPFFMWIHLMEPHSPYLPPPPHDRVSPRAFSNLADLQINEALYHCLHRQWGAAPEHIVHPSMEDLGLEKEQLTEHLLGLYEGEIRFCDDALGRLFRVIEQVGLLDNTIVVMTADHGEEFFDHGYVTHHFESALAEELIRIPLLIRPPGGLPDRLDIDRLVRMVDIAPTILDLAGLPEAAASMEGASLRPMMEGLETEPRVAYYSTIQYEIVRTERWKYRLERGGSVDGQSVERLFDIVADPMETRDLASKHPEVVAAMRADYAVFAEQLSNRGSVGAQGAAATDPPGVVDEETRKRLEALGYQQ